MQTQQKGKIGLIPMGVKVFKTDGILGLYNGLSASILRQVRVQCISVILDGSEPQIRGEREY